MLGRTYYAQNYASIMYPGLSARQCSSPASKLQDLLIEFPAALCTASVNSESLCAGVLKGCKLGTSSICNNVCINLYIGHFANYYCN